MTRIKTLLLYTTTVLLATCMDTCFECSWYRMIETTTTTTGLVLATNNYTPGRIIVLISMHSWFLKRENLSFPNMQAYWDWFQYERHIQQYTRHFQWYYPTGSWCHSTLKDCCPHHRSSIHVHTWYLFSSNSSDPWANLLWGNQKLSVIFKADTWVFIFIV